jgi:AraC-like DNA-binding protein
MGGSGSALFADPNDYQANLPPRTHLLALEPAVFQARLTWVDLADLNLLHARETGPRIAYVSLSPEWVFINFPTQRSPTLIYDGAPLQLGDIVFHSVGQQLHQRTIGDTAWASIALTPGSLLANSKTLLGRELAPSSSGQILRPSPADRRQLLKLHAEAVRITETQLGHIGKVEVARALQQDLIWALMACLTTGKPRDGSAVMRRYARVMVRFEEALVASADRPLPMPEICGVIGVSERSLRDCCLEILGMEPAQYLHLRYLQRVRRALLCAEAAAKYEAEVTKRYGFGDRDQFVAAYRNAFGEFPHLNPKPAVGRRI